MMRYVISMLLLVCFSSNANAQNNCKCCDEEYRQFDFWAGNWKTYDPAGKLVGTNMIDLIQDSCILRENWKSAISKYTGTSYNFYDKNSKTWTQTWVDNQGGSLIMKGNFSNNKMILRSEPVINEDGSSVINKITWTDNNDGSVRQLWETKTDNGEWIIAFDGNYVRF